MLVFRIIIEYKCPYCHHSENFMPNFVQTPVFLDDLPPVLEKQPQRICRFCFGEMSIAKMRCSGIEDVFGNREKGSWFCPKHSIDRYYPTALESASQNNVVLLTKYEDYKKIIKEGFPWKCPKCKANLVYMENEN